MTSAEVAGTLDRIVFATTDDGRSHVVGSSLSAGELAGWTEVLGEHVTVESQDKPPASLWYSSDGGGAALLRRIRAGCGPNAPNGSSAAGPDGGVDGAGDRCHALVGWHRDLTSELALRLHSWAGWSGTGWSGQDLQRLDLAYSRFEHARPRDLDRAAFGQVSSLVPLVAAVLRDPHRPISVVSPPTGLASRAALLWGLRAVVGDLLDVPGEPPFTFSTFEARHAAGGSAVPRVAFLPSDTPDPFPATCRAVRLPSVPAMDAAGGSRDDAYTYAARALVRSYLVGGADAVREWLDQRRVRASNSVADRVHRVLETAEVVPAAAPAPPAPAASRPPAAPPAGRAAAQRMAAQFAGEKPGGERSAGERPGGERGGQERPDGERGDGERGDGEPPAAVITLADLDLTQLADADPDTVRRVVRSLGTRRGAGADRSRADARELLLRDPSWEQRLSAVLAPAEAADAVDALVRFAFLPDLRADDVAPALCWLVATLDASSVVLDSLLRLVVEHGEHRLLLEPAGHRWLRERGYLVADPGPPPARAPRSEHAYRHLLHQGGRAGASRSRASRTPRDV